MSEEHWTRRLSEYLDGEMDRSVRSACEAHLRECPGCSAILADLRAIRAEAGALPDLDPPADLWPGIEARLEPRLTAPGGAAPDRAGGAAAPGEAAEAGIRTPMVPDARALRPRRRRFTFTAPQLAAAAIALVLFSGGAVYLGLSPVVSETQGGATARVPAPTPSAVQVSWSAEYEATVAELEAEFLSRRPDLDPETVRVVEQNLAIIERAIADARLALESDPSSGFLNAHLADTRLRKVELLRRATMIDQTST